MIESSLVLFDQRVLGRIAVRLAVLHATTGGQALHVWDPGEEAAKTWPRAPLVFRQNRPWAHLFDQDQARLLSTAYDLGVRALKVGSPGTKYQHIDLCAGPLNRAMAIAKR